MSCNFTPGIGLEAAVLPGVEGAANARVSGARVEAVVKPFGGSWCELAELLLAEGGSLLAINLTTGRMVALSCSTVVFSLYST